MHTMYIHRLNSKKLEYFVLSEILFLAHGVLLAILLDFIFACTSKSLRRFSRIVHIKHRQ